MTVWDGTGLPPAAHDRIERARSSSLRTSLLSVPAALSIESVGFEAVGEVLGCLVSQVAFAGYGGIPMGWGSAGYVSQVITSDSRYSGYGPLVHAITSGWTTAISRMRIEAAALGADGVVGVQLTETWLDGQIREFMALGTAVRARTGHRTELSEPFTTGLPGTDFAKLVLSGWMPASICFGLEIAVRPEDAASRMQASSVWNRSNVEVAGYTELVQTARQLSRDRFGQAVHTARAEGGIVSKMSLRMGGNEGVRIAEAMVQGTGIVHFGARRSEVPPPLTMIPVTAGKGRATKRRTR